MKQSKLMFLICALVLTGIAVTSLNCMFPGSMNGRIGINISDQPAWGPEGYDYAEYYYIPEIDCYYSVSEHQYIYKDGPAWRHSSVPPSTVSGYDPYHSYKIVINEHNPYDYHARDQARYETYKHKRDQPVIRDSRDSKYFENKDHPEHDKWVKGQHRN